MSSPSFDMLASFWLLSLAALTAPTAARFVLNIVHVNDMHAHIAGVGRDFSACDAGGDDCYGGFPRVQAAAEQLIAQDPERTIYLNAGDNFQGSAYFTFFKSEVILEFLNPMKFDVLNLGNHEFDEGVPELQKFVQTINAPVVCANLNLTLEPSLLNNNKLVNWTMIEKAGVKIGIVGYITTDTKTTSNAGNVNFLEEVAVVQKYAAEAKAQGAQIVIALGHSGYIIDQNVAKLVKEVDIVVGGHSHTFLYTGEPPDPDDTPMGPYPTMVTQDDGKIVPVVQAFKYTKYLGNFQVEFDDNFKLTSATGTPILMSPDLPKDPELLKVLEVWEEKLNELVPPNKVLTYIDKPASLENCRFEECEIGDMIADSLAEIACNDYPACIGIYNGGGIRGSLKAGNLTAVNLFELLPFGNILTIVQMDGAYLLEMLEQSVQNYDITHTWPKGNFLQMSEALRVVYNVTAPPGSRVQSAMARTANPANYAPVQSGQLYNIVTIVYVYEGGDNFTVFKDHDIPTISANMTDYEAVDDYLQRQSHYTPKLDGRIQITGGAANCGRLQLSTALASALILIANQLLRNFSS